MEFLQRQPFAFLGAVSLLSLIQDLLLWQEQLGLWIEAWRYFTSFIWRYSIDPVLWLFGVSPLSQLAKDYLTLSLIMGGAGARAIQSTEAYQMQYFIENGAEKRGDIWVYKNEDVTPDMTLFFPMFVLGIVVWPLYFWMLFGKTVDDPELNRGIQKRARPVFFEILGYVALIVAINFMLFSSGG